MTAIATFSDLIKFNVRSEYVEKDEDDEPACVMSIMELLNMIGASDCAEIIDTLMRGERFVTEDNSMAYSLTTDPVDPIENDQMFTFVDGYTLRIGCGICPLHRETIKS